MGTSNELRFLFSTGQNFLGWGWKDCDFLWCRLQHFHYWAKKVLLKDVVSIRIGRYRCAMTVNRNDMLWGCGPVGLLLWQSLGGLKNVLESLGRYDRRCLTSSVQSSSKTDLLNLNRNRFEVNTTTPETREDARPARTWREGGYNPNYGRRSCMRTPTEIECLCVRRSKPLTNLLSLGYVAWSFAGKLETVSLQLGEADSITPLTVQ